MRKMSLINSNLLFLLICLILSKFSFVYSEASILEFAAYHYRAGHFAFDSHGNMVIEYSRNNHRLFFGLKKDGNVFFEDDDHNLSPTKEFHIGDNANTCKRYESENWFVVNNANGEEYLFTLGSSTSYTELHNIFNDKYLYKPTGEFLGEQIFSFRFPLLNITNSQGKKEYVVAMFREDDKKYKVKKFSFNSFTLSDNNVKTNPDQYELSFTHRVSSGFIMNDWIVVFFIDYAKWYSIDIYDFDLNWLNKESIPRIDFCDYEFIVPNVERTGLFSKSCLLKDNYAFFIYYLKEDEWSLKFKVYQINSVTSYVEKLAKNFWDYSGYEYKLNVEIRLNELVRINHERLAFIALPSLA